MKHQSATKVITCIYAAQVRHSKDRGHNLPEYTKLELSDYLKNSPVFMKLYDVWYQSGYLNSLKPSVDRLNNQKGYSFDNIQIITWGDNRSKQGENQKKVVVQKFDGKTVALHESVNAAALSVDGKQSKISRVLCGGRQTYKGYEWGYG